MRHTQLRAFDAVARAGSFTDAADRLGLTQPALTIQVRNLEKSFGLRVFERAGDGVRMTGAGHDLFLLTRELFEVEDRIETFLTASGDLETGELRVASDGPHLAMRLIAGFRQRYPGIGVSLSLGNAPEVWRMLDEGLADAVIAADPPIDGRHQVVPLQETAIVAIVCAGHDWSARRSITLKALAAEPLIMRERRSNTRRFVERTARRIGIDLQPNLELGSREAVIEAVAAGLGVGFMFSGEVTPDPRYRAISISDAKNGNLEVIGHAKKQKDNAVVQAFVEISESCPGLRRPKA